MNHLEARRAGRPGPATEAPRAARARQSQFARLRHAARVVLLALLAGLGLLGSGAAQAFCGFYAGRADAALFNRASQVVLAREGQRTVISMLNDYQGPLSQFALVVPTPEPILPGQVKVAERAVFEHLDAFSGPRLAEYHDPNPCQFYFSWGQPPLPVPSPMAARSLADGSADAKALGVTIAARFTLEEYDIVSLSGRQSSGIVTWLRQNGYHLPRGAAQALAPYVRQGMNFFVAKVNLKEQARLGYSMLRPLQFGFNSPKFMLPMRLGMLNAAPGEPQDLVIYVLTRSGRVEAGNYRTVRMPTGDELPPSVQPHFGRFYKAVFDRLAQREDFQAVFTEYFWDMNWCDPCAAQPLSPQELQKAGAFWVGDGGRGGARDAKITRLHLRYTPRTLPEDLMLVQVPDSQNFQARYVIRHPNPLTESQCQGQMDGIDCRAQCGERISRWPVDRDVGLLRGRDRNDPAVLQECLAACNDARARAVDATRHYRSRLPDRQSRERERLMQLTGWSDGELAAMGMAR